MAQGGTAGSVETDVIRMRVAFAEFRRFRGVQIQPVGPPAKRSRKCRQTTREQLKARLREQVPVAADGSIAYEAFANAVKGRTPREGVKHDVQRKIARPSADRQLRILVSRI